MEIKVDPEQINTYVAQRIIESSLGKNMAEIIDKQFSESLRGYNSPLEAMVKDAIRTAVHDALADGWQEKIKLMIADRLSQEVIDNVVERAVKHAMDYLKTDRDY